MYVQFTTVPIKALSGKVCIRYPASSLWNLQTWLAQFWFKNKGGNGQNLERPSQTNDDIFQFIDQIRCKVYQRDCESDMPNLKKNYEDNSFKIKIQTCFEKLVVFLDIVQTDNTLTNRNISKYCLNRWYIDKQEHF